MRRRTLTLGCLSLVVVALGVCLLIQRGSNRIVYAPTEIVRCDSKDLRATQIALTLDAPIEKGINTIWCGSFLAAWKTLEQDLATAPLTLEGSPDVEAALIKSVDPRPDVPEGSLYATTGWSHRGVVARIRRELAARFPNATPPSFPGLEPDSLVAYGYLESSSAFGRPYTQNPDPMVFGSPDGSEARVRSFGVLGRNNNARSELRQQPRILFVARDNELGIAECAIDLDRRSQPTQIILALIQPSLTLTETLADVENKIAEYEGETPDQLVGSDLLLVPDMAWHILHRFSELEGQGFSNARLHGYGIEVAQQEIRFRLDRSGAELKSDAQVVAVPCIPTAYIFNRPFLIYMKKREAANPFFVMWVGNAELLTPSQEDAADDEKERR